MNKSELLILNGSPGSGKTTLADAIAEQLREAAIAHAVIDLDEFAVIYSPDNDSVEWGNKFKWKNLAAVWPNYIALGDIKIIVPVVIDTNDDFEAIKAATRGTVITVCELTAPTDILIDRVTAREPNEYWKKRLRGLVENYNRRSEDERFADIKIATHQKSVTDTATLIIEKLNWQS